jgi:hypothetical protein
VIGFDRRSIRSLPLRARKSPDASSSPAVSPALAGRAERTKLANSSCALGLFGSAGTRARARCSAALLSGSCSASSRRSSCSWTNAIDTTDPSAAAPLGISCSSANLIDGHNTASTAKDRFAAAGTTP